MSNYHSHIRLSSYRCFPNIGRSCSKCQTLIRISCHCQQPHLIHSLSNKECGSQRVVTKPGSPLIASNLLQPCVTVIQISRLCYNHLVIYFLHHSTLLVGNISKIISSWGIMFSFPLHSLGS